KESMPLISPPNLYNVVFQNIDNELCTYITFAIVKKIKEQINHSFLYYAIQIEPDRLVTNIEVLCDTNCIEEVFDLLQTYANDILSEVYDQLISAWKIPTVSSEINRLTKESQEIAQQHLSAKQQFAKVFEINMILNTNNCRSRDTSIVINNTIQDENTLNNTLNNESNSSNEAKFDTNEVKKRKGSNISIENSLTKCHKGWPPGAQRILSSIEVNQQSRSATKIRSIKCAYCNKTGHNIRSYKIKSSDEIKD
ncbi:3666_t:CDS:2, partial [Racocetra persica]